MDFGSIFNSCFDVFSHFSASLFSIDLLMVVFMSVDQFLMVFEGAQSWLQANSPSRIVDLSKTPFREKIEIS